MSKSRAKSRKTRRSSIRRRDAKHTQKTKRAKSPEAKVSRPKRILSIVERLLAFWGVLLTIWVVYYPRVSVDPALPLDPNNPAFTPFVVQNQGYLDIHDVKFSCSMKYIKFPGGTLAIAQKEYDNKFSDPEQIANVIAAGEKYTELLPLTGMENNQIENADIAIVLSYRPIGWLPWHRKTRHRFVSTRGKDGRWHWLPQPINE